MDMTREMNETVEAGSEAMGKAKETFKKGKEAVGKYASQARDYATEYAGKAKDKTETTIRENPFWAMAVAMGVGVAIGMVACSAFKSSSDYEY
jgi:ElaB/YqjD/DUF883 family membrane-anchored ribosome-binding protein